MPCENGDYSLCEQQRHSQTAHQSDQDHFAFSRALRSLTFCNIVCGEPGRNGLLSSSKGEGLGYFFSQHVLLGI